ncbi:MAG: 2Fe-2S iron-sulfur cluster-binding protein [Pyrinomonadaceae bacterium]
MTLPDIFQPYDRLIEIKVLGAIYTVPDNNTLLRCFQYLAMESISYGEFCWNGECLNCQVWIKIGDKEKAVMACRTMVTENLEIVRMAESIDLSAN